MKLNTRHLKEEIVKILNEDGISVEELAAKSNIHPGTIYAILTIKHETSQRATGRKIAEGSGREFTIEDDKIYYSKKELPMTVKEPNAHYLNNDPYLKNIFKQLEEELKGASEEKKKLIQKLISIISRMDDEGLEAMEELLSRIR